MGKKEFYTPGEIAKLFGVTPKTVSNWCDQGRIESITTPSGHRRIPVSAVKGGHEYDKQLENAKSLLNEKNKLAPVTNGDEIAKEVQERRYSKETNKIAT